LSHRGLNALARTPDENNDRIQKFDAAGNFVVKWGDVSSPHHLAVDGSGYVYVMHYGEGPVVKFRCPISTPTSTSTSSTTSTTSP
jgi:hypothetical protein